MTHPLSPVVPDSKVLFELLVTKARLRQVIVGLPLICRSPYCGVVEFLLDAATARLHDCRCQAGLMCRAEGAR